MPNNTAHPENAATWREIADQLSHEQIAEIARFEASERGDKPHALLTIARGMAAENMAATVLSDLPTPAGAVSVDRWEHISDDTWGRHFNGTTRRVGPATVTIHGEQFSDGHCKRWISFRDADELTSAQMRELIAAECAATDEMDGLVS
jgi:hypothetical protein